MKQRHIFGSVFTLEAAVALGVFVAILGLLAVLLVRRRARGGVAASQRREHLRLEGYYVAVLAAFAVFLVSYTAWQNHRETATAATAGTPPVRVDVTAFQWCWKFDYPQADGPVKVTAPCKGGKVPTLVVPTGRPVQIHLTSRDVIHSLWVPALRYKMDAFPHHVNTFTLTLDKQGQWVGRCAEYCGERHSSMHFLLKAVSPEKYDQWLHAHSAAHTGGAAV